MLLLNHRHLISVEDGEFARLVHREDKVDLALVALEIARDAEPELDFKPVLQWLDARASDLRPAISRSVDDRSALKALGDFLGRQHGFRGNEQVYTRPQSSYLHRVIESRQGVPIALSLLYIALGERVGLDLQGVCAPVHFVVRYDAAEGPLFIDAFASGRLMSKSECIEMLAIRSGLSPVEVSMSLRPSGPRQIVTRMLNNLKILHVQQHNWDAAWATQGRLVALQPASYMERRDLAITALKTNRPGIAYDLLQDCLPRAPEAERDELLTCLRDAERGISALN